MALSFSFLAFGLVDGFYFLTDLVSSGIVVSLDASFGIFTAGNSSTSRSGDLG